MELRALILAHRHERLLARLVRQLRGLQVRSIVHVDGKAGLDAFEAACAGQDATFLRRRVDVRWGGFSMVRATLGLVQAALAEPAATHFLLLSGDSYVTKPRRHIERAMASGLDLIDVEEIGPDEALYNRISRTFLFDHRIAATRGPAPADLLRYVDDALVHDLPLVIEDVRRKKRPFPWRYAKGGQWWCLTRASLERGVLFLARNPEFANWFRFSSVPDESFFQSMLLNAGVVGGQRLSPVYADWRRSPAPFTFTSADDAALLLAAPHLAARKFSDASGDLLDAIDEGMRDPARRAHGPGTKPA